MNDMTVPDLVDAVCARHGINKRSLAKLIECSPATITRWSQGEREPRYSEMDKLRGLLRAGKRTVQQQLRAMA